MEVFENIIQKFTQKNILVIGDLSLEEHIKGKNIRYSSEGPVPKVEVKERNYYPIGAGHAAAIVQALGLKAHIVGLVGHDTNGKILLEEFLKRNINIDGVFIHEDLTTDIRVRISVSGEHQPSNDILRIETPVPKEIKGAYETKLLNEIQKKIDFIDAILFVDKSSVLIKEDFIKKILKIAQENNILIIADAERERERFKDFDILICNDKEASETSGIEIADSDLLEEAGKKIVDEFNLKYVIITRGSKGMGVIPRNGQCVHLETRAQQVFDVTGAGETVSATLAAALVAGANVIEAGRLANYTAGIVVSKSGPAVVSSEELLEIVRKESARLDANKLVTLEELKDISANFQKHGKLLVWTNGCFDLMHGGHLLYLQHARAQGDALVVGLNSDASIRQVKGPTRPIVEESQRAKLLSSLTCVDYVIIFSDNAPLSILETIKPGVYVKGGDYTIDTINQDERRLVEGYGGKIALMPGVKGMSTTNLIKKILDTADSKN